VLERYEEEYQTDSVEILVYHDGGCPGTGSGDVREPDADCDSIDTNGI